MNIVRMFSKMLDSIPHDQAFTQLIVNQIVTYYQKSYGWFKGKGHSSTAYLLALGLTTNRAALMSRVSPQHQGGAHLKSAAVFAETEEIREAVRQLWEASADERQELIDKVENAGSFNFQAGTLTGLGNRPSYQTYRRQATGILRRGLRPEDCPISLTPLQ
jgi:hypothetical protein